MDALIEQTRTFAAVAYESDADFEHAQEVAELVEAAGCDSEAVAAAWLHDVVEDTDVSVPELDSRFGPHVAALVSALTEDESINGYEARKAEHRGRVRAAGREAAAIFVADKLSNARRMRRAQKQPKLRKIKHYTESLELMRSHYPDLPLLNELERELEALHLNLQRAPA
jgi:(p)ppGpp synthase/HD superfamily hydrolase